MGDRHDGRTRRRVGVGSQSLYRTSHNGDVGTFRRLQRRREPFKVEDMKGWLQLSVAG